MELLTLIIVIPICFSIHYLLFTKKTKLLLQKTLGDWFINHFYRVLYAILTILLLYFFIATLATTTPVPLINMQDSLSNIIFLIIDTLRLIFLFLMVESVWTLGMTNVFGIKHLLSIFSKKKLSFNLDFIVSTFKVKGLYLRHRHPFLLYLILFILLDRTLSLQNIFAVIFLSGYYMLFAKLVEAQLKEIYPKDFEKYRANTNYFLIMLKKYQDEPTTK